MLRALDELGPLIEKRASLADRIQKMESDQRRFMTEIQSLAKALDMEITSAPLDLATQVTRTLEKARAAETAPRKLLQHV